MRCINCNFVVCILPAGHRVAPYPTNYSDNSRWRCPQWCRIKHTKDVATGLAEVRSFEWPRKWKLVLGLLRIIPKHANGMFAKSERSKSNRFLAMHGNWAQPVSCDKVRWYHLPSRFPRCPVRQHKLCPRLLESLLLLFPSCQCPSLKRRMLKRFLVLLWDRYLHGYDNALVTWHCIGHVTLHWSCDTALVMHHCSGPVSQPWSCTWHWSHLTALSGALVIPLDCS